MELHAALVVQLLSPVQLFGISWTQHTRFPCPYCLLEFAKIHVHWVCDTTYLSNPQLPPPPSVFNLSQHQGLNKSVLHIKWPKYWSFSFNISPSNECSQLISFRIDWFDFFAIQGTLKTLLQHYNSKASIPWCAAFLRPNSHICTWLLVKP